MSDTLIIVAIIAVLSVVQSVFGMGLLIFGTPTLLLLGLPFADALAWLLPASMAISAMQVAESRDEFRRAWSGLLPLFCLVPLVLALSWVLRSEFKLDIQIAVGCVMIAAACVRTNAQLQRHLHRAVSSAERLYLVAMGLLHGFTNMGGAMLSIYASVNGQTKQSTRGIVSAYYLCFGSLQLMTLAALQPNVFAFRSCGAAIVALMIYLGLGRTIFAAAGSASYQKAVTGFMAAYGVAVLVRSTV
jgi:uncharacterized protein